jgi:hypothetical protein
MPEDYFDFHTASEEQEELDYKHLVECPHCKKPIPQNATMCYYCGEEITFGKKPLWIIWTAIVLIIIFLGFIILFW